MLRIKQQHDTCVAYLHIHIAGLSFCFLFARLFPISLFPIILILIVRTPSLYYMYENINTNASESLQTFYRYDHYKCVAPLIRMACELLPNMLRMCVFTNFRNMFLKFAKPREQPQMYTNTNECKAITMQQMRFVTELPRYYVNDTIRNIFARM